MVELIVVIVVLTIIWTLWFISLTKYSRDARNSSRISDVRVIEKALNLYYLKNAIFPDPDDLIEKEVDWIVLWKQWIVWTWVYKELRSLSNNPIDPSFNVNYSYSVTYDNLNYQIWFIEEK